MDQETQAIIEAGVAASLAGTGNFGEHVAALMARGVESYRVDYRQRASTYFMPSGASHTVAFPALDQPIGEAFDQPAIVAAIQGSQQGVVKYPEFLERSMRAGCVGYVVWLAGRHVSYFGRRGETHVEPFPQTP